MGPLGRDFRFIAHTVKIGGNNVLDGQKYKSQNQPVINNLEMHDVSQLNVDEIVSKGTVKRPPK